MAKIQKITATEILDAKGNPTVEAAVMLDDGSRGIAACPSGTSVGTYEALDLRDKDQQRYNGLGVKKAIDNITNLIAPKLIGISASDQSEVDNIMLVADGTSNKSVLGANATLSVSMAVCKAAANSAAIPLYAYIRQFVSQEHLPLKIPTPLFNLVNGGAHAGQNIDFQEFMVIPASSKSYNNALQIGSSVYQALKKIIIEKGMSALVGDEGGYGPKLPNNMEGFALLTEAVNAIGLRMGADVFFGLDAAADSFITNKKYHLKDRETLYSTSDLVEYYQELNQKYHLLYLEDGFSEDDWDGFSKLTEAIGKNTIVTGDDLTVTNPSRLQTAITKKAITGIIIKPNQIGTVIETMAVVEIARVSGIKIIVSHRSGETNDDFIADFAVGIGADYVKFGAPARGERVAKYNRLSHIEEELH